MQAYYCLVARLTRVAGLALVTGICLITTVYFYYMQAYCRVGLGTASVNVMHRVGWGRKKQDM